MVMFHRDWYEKLIARSNEKELLVKKIADLLKGRTYESCLEIGLGTSSFFSDNLGHLFHEYSIIEKEEFNGPLKKNVNFIRGDFDNYVFEKEYDVIIASHVVYYFADLSLAIEKINNLLANGGCAYFVVNGKESDYGNIKKAFSSMIDESYIFTYDSLKKGLKDFKFSEYTVRSSLNFSSYEDLFETLRLSFDLYPNQYQEQRDNVIQWLRNNVRGNKFSIDQKIIEVSK